MRDENEIVWLPTINDKYWGYFWTNYLTAIRFSNNSQDISFEKAPAITDSGSSCIVGPSAQITQIQRNVLKNVTIDFVDKSWGNVFSCSYLRNG